MNPLFLIPVVLAVAGVFFMTYINKNHTATTAEIDLNVERTTYDIYKQELL